jgi:hypothetical protein
MPSVYEEVGNLRITFVPADERKPGADWAGSDVIRVQAFRQDPAISKSLNMGPEFPCNTEAELENVIGAIRRAFENGRTRTPR